LSRALARPATGVALVAVAVTVAACGSDKSSSGASSSGSTSASSSQNPQLPPAPKAAAGADVKGAQQFLLSRLGTPKFQPAGPAFDIKSVTKPVWLLQAPASTPPDADVTEGFIEAAKASGAPYHVCPAEGTPEGNARCLKQAEQAGAGSAVIWSQIPDSIRGPLKQAKAAGVKVVGGNLSLHIGDPVDPDLNSAVSHDYYGAGENAGAYAVAALGGAVDSICIDLPEYVTGTSVCKGFSDVVTKFCPQCKVVKKNVSAQAFNAQTGAAVSQSVLPDPKLNFIMNAYDASVPLVIAQLRSLGKKPNDVMVGGQNGTIEALQAMKNGQYDVVSSGQNAHWWGWAFFDAGARAQASAIGNKTVVTSPNKLFTKETFKYSGDISFKNSDAMYGFGDGSIYRQGYQSLWKK
jgi:ABC-type sugar transport system substrate-binding protein